MYVVAVEPVLDVMIDHVLPLSVERSTSYPVIAEPPLFDGAVQERLICDGEATVAFNPVGGCGMVPVITDVVCVALISTATSVQRSPTFAVQLHVTVLGDCTKIELDAPVIAFGMLMSHPCAHVGLERVEPP